MGDSSALMQAHGALHITQIAADLFRGSYVSVYVELPDGKSHICFTVFDMLQYQHARHTSPLLLIGLRFESYGAYFDQVELPLPDPDALSACFSDDQIFISTDAWKMTILNLDRLISEDAAVRIESAVPSGAGSTASSP